MGVKRWAVIHTPALSCGIDENGDYTEAETLRLPAGFIKGSVGAGDAFTAADISVTYALEFAQRTGCFTLGEAEQAYVARTTRREAYGRAMQTCHGTRAWAAAAAGQR